MNILNNAIDSINLGLEDYESSDHRRLISCTRKYIRRYIAIIQI